MLDLLSDPLAVIGAMFGVIVPVASGLIAATFVSVFRPVSRS